LDDVDRYHSALAKPVDSIIRKRSNIIIMPFRLSRWKLNNHFFQHASLLTVLHWTQCGLVRSKLSVRLSVCPFVRLSVKRVHCDKTEERSVQVFIPYERAFSLVF